MGKVRVNIINGLPIKAGWSNLEIGGRYLKRQVKRLYRRVAHKLPVDLGYYYLEEELIPIKKKI